ncbi:MAG: phosphoglucosamine mutase [Acidobacteriota bacterium]
MTAPRLFGTDGIRAPFGSHPLDQPTVGALGAALGETLRRHSEVPRIVLGGDTRDSRGPLAAWLATGLAASGVRVFDAGVLPTPGVAFLVREHEADAGVALSASHNPYPDNGIKLIDAQGFKWTPEAEAALEERMAAKDLPGATEGSLEPLDSASYRESLVASLGSERLPLAGLRLALDTGHGAASALAGALFDELGAEVTLLGHSPDGQNINRDCGSTEPGELAETVRRERLDAGFAFDGDADRAILVDEEGTVRDGDHILYLWARDLAAAGHLDPKALVVTSMSNLGLERALAADGIEVLRCGVGDRQVVDTLRRHDLALGGEQSGHIVNLRLSTTGDGLLTALQTAAILRRADRPVSALLSAFRRFPQILQNVTVARKPDLTTLPAVVAAARDAEERLGQEGRLVLRYSGTEPLARVMIEGPDQATIERLAGNIAHAIAGEIGAESA